MPPSKRDANKRKTPAELLRVSGNYPYMLRLSPAESEAEAPSKRSPPSRLRRGISLSLVGVVGLLLGTPQGQALCSRCKEMLELRLAASFTEDAPTQASSSHD